MRSAWGYSLSAIIFLFMGAVSLHAATADITNISFTTTPTEITAGEKGYFTVEARDSGGNTEAADSNVTVTLSDDGSGTFYAASGSSCSSTELSSDEVTIASGSSTASFCYENTSAGDYNLTASISESGTGASGHAADATYGAENVWTNGYEAVWHMEEVLSPDSTSGGYDITSVTGDPTLVSGGMGNAVDFDGSADKLHTSSAVPFDSTGLSSVSSLVSFDGLDSNQYIFIGEDGASNLTDVIFWHRSTGALQASMVHDDGGSYVYTGNVFSTGVYHQAAYTFSGGTDAANITLYVDGAIASNAGASNSSSGNDTTSAFNSIGGRSYDNQRDLDGRIDELRVSSVVRSTDWLSAEYTNQNTPTTFYNTGAEETDTGGSWYGSDWDHRKQITVAASEVGSDLTDFPVYIDLSDLGSDFFSGVKDNGGDIRITTADGTTELAREVVSVDTGSETGELHFKADSLSSSSDTDFYIYYGNGTSSASTSVSVIAAATGVGSGDILEPGGRESDDNDIDTTESDEEDTDQDKEDKEEEAEELTSSEASYYQQVLNDARNAINEIMQSIIKSLIKQRTGLEPWNFTGSF